MLGVAVAPPDDLEVEPSSSSEIERGSKKSQSVKLGVSPSKV
tara:strand:- start:586 stop:711 length:126 start_codon:yes stop_codon:yes gene_type:complete